MTATNETLLQRVRRTDAHEAWRELYAAYRGPVLSYARKMGLRGHAADEVLQDTFVVLMRVLPKFQYDRQRGRFRNFLLRIVDHRARAALKRRCIASRRSVSVESVDGTGELADDVPARIEGEEWQRARDSWRGALAAEALARVRRDPATRPRTMAIFDEFAMQGAPAEQVAARHGVSIGNVHQIRHRTLQRVQRELAQLLTAAGEEPA